MTSGGTVDCSRESGNDAGQKIQACLDALPAGGIADARSFRGPQTIAQSIVLNTAGTILLLGSRATFMLGDEATLDLVASNVRIEGTGATSVILLGNHSSVRVGSVKQPIWLWSLERLAIEPALGKQPKAGLVLINAREGIVHEVSISGFPGFGIDVGDNCWSDRFIDSYVVKNDIGYNFHGDNLNAWNIRGGLINGNRIGLNVDLGNGKLQGVSITDGTQMEANTDTGIRLVSGVMQGIFLSSIYAEIFQSQRLIKSEPSGSALRVNLLSMSNAYVYSERTAPIYLVSGSQDLVSASISGLLLRHSQQKLPVAEISGADTSITISESASTSASNAFSEELVVVRDGARGVTVRGGIPTR
jgi:hypothetical protein